MVDFSATITGVDTLRAAFAALPEETAKKALRPGLRKAAQLVKKQAISNLKSIVSQESTGLLEKSIIAKSVKGKVKSDIRVAVAIKGGVFNPKNNQRVGLYGSVLEFGKEGQLARPWLRPAIRQNAQEAINILIDFVRSKLPEVVSGAKK